MTPSLPGRRTPAGALTGAASGGQAVAQVPEQADLPLCRLSAGQEYKLRPRLVASTGPTRVCETLRAAARPAAVVVARILMTCQEPALPLPVSCPGALSPANR